MKKLFKFILYLIKDAIKTTLETIVMLFAMTILISLLVGLFWVIGSIFLWIFPNTPNIENSFGERCAFGFMGFGATFLTSIFIFGTINDLKKQWRKFQLSENQK